MDEKQLLELPGVGKDLARKIRELADTGTCRFHQELLLEFPPTILDLLRLQGVGPKTVALLYSSLNIRSVDELVEAAKAGRLRALKGMGPKKEALILKAVEERQKDRGRHLLVRHHGGRGGAGRLPARTCAGRGVHAGRQPAPRVRDVRRHRYPRHAAPSRR